jgi:hypothetical protein
MFMGAPRLASVAVFGFDTPWFRYASGYSTGGCSTGAYSIGERVK